MLCELWNNMEREKKYKKKQWANGYVFMILYHIKYVLYEANIYTIHRHAHVVENNFFAIKKLCFSGDPFANHSHIFWVHHYFSLLLFFLFDTIFFLSLLASCEHVVKQDKRKWKIRNLKQVKKKWVFVTEKLNEWSESDIFSHLASRMTLRLIYCLR